MNYESTGEVLEDNHQSQKPPKEGCRGITKYLTAKAVEVNSKFLISHRQVYSYAS
jgi:hypothetical protein